MQPYFFPYIGYFQLIAAVDLFIVYDNIKYTKKGWINRNRFLQNGGDALFALPLQKDSDFLDVRDRNLAPDFNRDKLLNQFREAYRRAPHFEPVFAVLAKVVTSPETNLFRFLHTSIEEVCDYLGIETRIAVSSDIAIDHSLQGKEKVMALCRAVEANTYINPIGGRELYSKSEFAAQGIELKFLKSRPYEYPQFGGAFVPWLSIIDVMMFNPKEGIRECLTGNFDLI